jgi:hypothetical protein
MQELRKAMTRLVDTYGTEALSLSTGNYRSKAEAQLNDPLAQLSEWTKVKQAVDYAVELCQVHSSTRTRRPVSSCLSCLHATQRNASRDHQGEVGKLWFDVLETLSKERSA